MRGLSTGNFIEVYNFLGEKKIKPPNHVNTQADNELLG